MTHRFEDHTGEVKLVITAPSLKQLFAEAARGLAELMLERPEQEVATSAVSCVVRARDRDALLADWLNELIYLSEMHGVVYTNFEIDDLSERELRARVRGVATQSLRTAPKAATLHGLCIEQGPHGFSASVILDV